MEPKPPPHLNAELAGVWSGWRSLGDREVVREAAAKGTHIDLAHSFLSLRRSWDPPETEQWFRAEVHAWVLQLLLQRQVFKATHILTNIKLDPHKKFVEIFQETKDPQLRDFLGDHLEKFKILSEDLKQHWILIKQVENLDGICLYEEFISSDKKVTINDLLAKDLSWKTNLATVIFFTTFDDSIVSLLDATKAWNYLLNNNKRELLNDWIHLSIGQNDSCLISTEIPSEKRENLHRIFRDWPITETMINDIEKIESFNYTKEYLYNQLSCYGIINSSAQDNITTILARFAKSENLHNIEMILKKNTSNLTLTQFYTLFSQFCIKSNLYTPLIKCLKHFHVSDGLIENVDSKFLQMWNSIRFMLNDIDSNQTIAKCILKTCDFLSDDLHEYLSENFFIFIALILCDSNIDFSHFFSAQENVVIENIEFSLNFVELVRSKLPFFRHVISRQSCNLFTPDITLYQLLANYQHLDMTQLFHFRFIGSAKAQENFGILPYFSSEYMTLNYGHRERLSFTYYLKTGRPSIASKLFTIENFKKYGKITNKSIYHAVNLAHSIALSNYENNEITSACVAFIEMIGIQSEILRIHINVAKLIDKDSDQENIKLLFYNFNENKALLYQMLQAKVMEKCNNIGIVDEKISLLLPMWDVVIKFANIHKLNYPENFLQYCLNHDLWLSFLIFAQYHSYPFEKILKLSRYFKSSNLSEHVSHAIGHKPKMISIKDKTLKKDSKKLAMTTSIPAEVDVEEIFVENDIYGKNLIQIICRCHRNKENVYESFLIEAKDHQNPVLAVFAACYKEEQVIACWLSWLCISVGLIDMCPQATENCIQAETVIKILRVAIMKQYFTSIADSCQIFLPENPLCSLFSFLAKYSQNFMNEKAESIKYLKLFKMVTNYKKYTDNDPNYINNHTWILNVAKIFLKYFLVYGLKSKYMQEKFVDILCEENIASDFSYIKKLLDLVSTTSVDLAVLLELEPIYITKNSALEDCINQLIEMKKFDVAIDLCLLETLPIDKVVVSKWKHKFETRSNAQDFWQECENSLKDPKVREYLTEKFFIDLACKLSDPIEQYMAFKLAFNYLKHQNRDDIHSQTIEIKMWELCLTIDNWDDLPIFTDDEKHLQHCFTELRAQSRIAYLLVSRPLESDEQRVQFEKLIGQFLDHGKIVTAIRLEFFFQHQTECLALLLTCMKLAEGEILPQDLPEKYQQLLQKNDIRTRRRRRFSGIKYTFESYPTEEGSGNNVQLSTVGTDRLSVLERLVDCIEHGASLANRILCCSRIAEATSRPYSRILATYDVSTLLKTVLTGDFDNKLELAYDIMSAHRWTKHQISEFVCAELVSAISKFVLQENNSVEPMSLWGYPLDSTVNSVLKLCSEPSLLGNALLVHATAPLNSATKNALCLAGELLIRSHDCFTADCNMKGISKVLIRARMLVSNLTQLQAWAALVRLLIGIGRYVEMEYIFQILKENEQFEYLLGQGASKAIGLRGAAMDYLRRRCPERRELARLVALRWGMYDSAAEIWESEAREIIRNVVNIARLEMQNAARSVGPHNILELSFSDPATKKCLENALTNLTHAVQHFLLAVRYSKATKTTQLAELVALQLGLLNMAAPELTAICILELSPDQISYLTANKLEFAETQIVANYYDYPVDWATVLYNQCVALGQYEKYLPAFLSAMPITDVLAKSIVRKYLVASKNEPVPPGLRVILETIESPSVKYRLASELGLRDMIHELLEGTAKYYLKDTVWKTGCPNS